MEYSVDDKNVNTHIGKRGPAPLDSRMTVYDSKTGEPATLEPIDAKERIAAGLATAEPKAAPKPESPKAETVNTEAKKPDSMPAPAQETKAPTANKKDKTTVANITRTRRKRTK